MASPPLSVSGFTFASVALVGIVALVAGCKNNNHNDGAWSQTTLNQATLPVPVQQPAPVPAPVPVAASAPHGERSLDTQPIPAAAPSPTAPAAAGPIFETKNRKPGVRTPSDEHLPKWVPVRGRLTVVDSSDLAENLGLVPPGTTKKSDERISVADKLAEENGTRAAAARDSATQGVSTSYAPGSFRSHR